MLVTARAIVLRTFRHSDRTVVLKAWTRHHGLRSYVVRAGAKATAAHAALQPLTRLELVAMEQPDRDLHSVREVRIEAPYLHIPTDPLRGSVALFVQELLYKVLRQESADEDLDDMVRHALHVLDHADDLSHFPLQLMVQLSAFLGFFPEYPEPGADRFDLREGHFVHHAAPHGHTMGPPLSTALAALLDAPLGTVPQPPLPSVVRRQLLDHLLLYYRIHLEGMGEMRSPAVLHQVLS